MNTVSYRDRILWNDDAILEEGNFKILVPNDYAKKYRLKPEDIKPMIVHMCPETDESDADFWLIDFKDWPNRTCDFCKEKIPDNIQSIWTLYHFDELAV